jgi:ABC-type iron transport system FetAB ATPase subunit
MWRRKGTHQNWKRRGTSDRLSEGVVHDRNTEGRKGWKEKEKNKSVKNLQLWPSVLVMDRIAATFVSQNKKNRINDHY